MSSESSSRITTVAALPVHRGHIGTSPSALPVMVDRSGEVRVVPLRSDQWLTSHPAGAPNGGDVSTLEPGAMDVLIQAASAATETLREMKAMFGALVAVVERQERALSVALADDDSPPEWITVEEAAKLLGKATSTFYDDLKKGQIPGTRKVSGRWRIERRAFLRGMRGGML